MAAGSGSEKGDSRSTSEDVLELGSALLTDFIYERIQRFGDATVTRDELGGTELSSPHHKKLAMCLQKIGDDLDSNVELQKMINDTSLVPSKEVFLKVTLEMFSDGKFNWGRVVALFYFACRLVIKALLRKGQEIIRSIIGWTIDYLRNNVLQWISEQGGWDGITSYFGTPTWQTVGVFLAGVLAAVVVIRKM